MERTATIHDIYVANSKVVLNTLFRNDLMTMQALAERTNLSLPTITGIIKTLKAEGLVTQGEKLESLSGRPAKYIQPNYNAAYCIGMHITDNYIRIVLSNLASHQLAHQLHACRLSNTPSYWETAASLLNNFIAETGVDTGRLLGVGLAIPGILTPDGDRMDIYIGEQAVYINSSDIKARFPQYPLAVNNDSKMSSLALAWGEPGLSDFVYLSLGDNIGGAIVKDRCVVDFETNNAAFGHMILDQAGKLCPCGMRGCFNAYCSSSALQEAAGVTLTDFYARLQTGDARYGEIWNDYLDHLSQALQNLRFIFDMDIVVGGSMSPYLKEHIEEITRRLSCSSPFEEKAEYLHILGATENAAAIGAGLVFVDRFLTSIM